MPRRAGYAFVTHVCRMDPIGNMSNVKLTFDTTLSKTPRRPKRFILPFILLLLHLSFTSVLYNTNKDSYYI
jgi:hypothetical protein